MKNTSLVLVVLAIISQSVFSQDLKMNPYK